MQSLLLFLKHLKTTESTTMHTKIFIFLWFIAGLFPGGKPGKREQMATATSVELLGENHGSLSHKRNSSEGSIEHYPYANEDTNETNEGK